MNSKKLVIENMSAGVARGVAAQDKRRVVW